MSNQNQEKKSKVTHKGDKQAESIGDFFITLGKTIGQTACLFGRYGKYSWYGIRKVTLKGTKHKIFFSLWLSLQIVSINQILFSPKYEKTAIALIIFFGNFPLLNLLFKPKKEIDQNQWFYALYNRLGFKQDMESNLQYPCFIDMDIDNKITIYKFWSNGNRMDIFIKNKELVEEYLTNQFGKYSEIVEINKNRLDKRIIEIKTINQKLEEFYRWGANLVPPQGKLLIGKSIQGDLVVKINSYYNLLICGEIGGGKSVATKNIIFQLLHQSIKGRPISITIADHKGAVDYNFLRKYLNIITDKATLLKYTEDLLDEMYRRTDLLIEKDVENASEYNDLVDEEEKMKRIVFVIDEIVECFDISDLDKKIDKEEIETTSKIKSNITKLARLARFVDINLILATQVPSMEFLGNQLRTNIPARLTGKMSDASSAGMVSKMATEIEDIAGRMVWKRGSTVLEVQTPFINNKFCKSYLSQMGDKLNLFDLKSNEIRAKKEEKQEKEITFEELQRIKLEKKQNKDISNE